MYEQLQKGFDSEKYKLYTWKSGLMLHWILNPGVAVLELVRGQRLPKVSLVEKSFEKPLIESSFIPCPHCEVLHDARTWSVQNGTAYKNWFGLYCPNCGGVIPCLTNVFTLLLLALTFPIWGWFRGSIYTKWLEQQPMRFENLDLSSKPPWVISGVDVGLKWGAFMFLLNEFIVPYFADKAITLTSVLVGLVVWTIAGLGFGYTFKLLMTKVLKKKGVSVN